MSRAIARCTTRALALVAATGLSGCGQTISDPWVSGEWGERLEDERTRTYAQKQELQGRLEAYAEPYE